MAKTNVGLVEYAKAQLGKPYWWGTYGKAASREYYEAKKRQYPKYYKWNYNSALDGVKVHDCVGLIKGYLWCDDVDDTSPSYNKNQDRSADGLKRSCKVSGSISTLPEVLGLLVFSSGHVGVYIGNGEVIEARDHAHGVVKTKVKERNWITWGKHPEIDYGDAVIQETETKKSEGDTVSVNLKVLKKGAKGEQVKAAQRLLLASGYELPKYKDDGSYGNETIAAVKAFQKDKGLAADGVTGKDTWAKLLGVS